MLIMVAVSAFQVILLPQASLVLRITHRAADHETQRLLGEKKQHDLAAAMLLRCDGQWGRISDKL
jgi:hypothetical protein